MLDQVLRLVVSGLIGYVVHHIFTRSKIMSQLDDLAAAQKLEATNIQILSAALTDFAGGLNKTLGDLKAAVDASKVSGNTPDLTGFIVAAQANADSIAKAAAELGTLSSVVTAADPATTVAPDPAPPAPVDVAPPAIPIATDGSSTSAPDASAAEEAAESPAVEATEDTTSNTSTADTSAPVAETGSAQPVV